VFYKEVKKESMGLQRTLFCAIPELLAPLLELEGVEVLLAATGFSKAGMLPELDLPWMCEQVRAKGKRPVLVWDRLEKDGGIKTALAALRPLLPFLAAVRVSDLGAALGLKETYPALELQLSLESHSPNQGSIRAWAKALEPKRLVLSNQMPVKEISGLQAPGAPADLPPLEIQVLGPLEVFYSPRPLLGEPGRWFDQQLSNPERPRQRSRITQTPAGTLVFHNRDLFLLDQLDRIARTPVGFVKLFPTHQEQINLIAGADQIQDYGALKAQWPHLVTRGFFSANRTDRPLRRLGNEALAKASAQALGMVLEAKKGAYLLLELFDSLPLPCRLRLVNPEGKEIDCGWTELKRLDGSTAANAAVPGLYLVPWVKGALARSLLLKEKEI